MMKETADIRITLDEGTKTVNLNRRAIRKADKNEWLKEQLKATKHLGIAEAEMKKALSDAFDAVRGTKEDDKPAK